jgi:hypothetical protein
VPHVAIVVCLPPFSWTVHFLLAPILRVAFFGMVVVVMVVIVIVVVVECCLQF